MKGESVKSICGRTRHELVGNGDSIFVYVTEDGALHSHYVSAGCVYVEHECNVTVIGWYSRPRKMSFIRDDIRMRLKYPDYPVVSR